MHAVALGGHRAARALQALVALEGAEELRTDVRATRDYVSPGRLDDALQRAIQLADRTAREGASRERKRTAHLCVAGVDCLPHRQRNDAVPVESGGERVAHAANRLGQLLALVLDLLHLGLELD